MAEDTRLRYHRRQSGTGQAFVSLYLNVTQLLLLLFWEPDSKMVWKTSILVRNVKKILKISWWYLRLGLVAVTVIECHFVISANGNRWPEKGNGFFLHHRRSTYPPKYFYVWLHACVRACVRVCMRVRVFYLWCILIISFFCLYVGVWIHMCFENCSLHALCKML